MRRYLGTDPAQREEGTADAVASAKRGELVLVHGDGAYVVITDAFSDRGVERLRALKAQPDMNVPVFVARLETVEGIATLRGEGGRVARNLMQASWPGALTVIATAQPSLAWRCTPNGTVAMRMPAQPWTLDVVRGIGPTAVVPAHARGEEPGPDADAALALLGDAVSVVLDAGPCAPDAGSSVVDATGEQVVLVREGALTLARLRDTAPELAARLLD